MKDDKKQNESVQEPKALDGNAAPNPESANNMPVDPFDPVNLGISTDYATAINAQASAKPVELRKPNDQEFCRTSPHKHQRLVVGAIADKQEMSRIYVVSAALLDDVKIQFPKAIRAVELVLTQTLTGSVLLWPVPLSEDRGGQWNSSQRSACHQGESRWMNMVAWRGKYDVTTIDNLKAVIWESFPPMTDMLRQALADGRLIDSLDHPVLRKLRGDIE